MSRIICVDRNKKAWTEEEFFRTNLHRYGLFKQLTKFLEECSEASVEVAKCVNRSVDYSGRPINVVNRDSIAEELADLRIVYRQIVIGLGIEEDVKRWTAVKEQRQILERWPLEDEKAE